MNRLNKYFLWGHIFKSFVLSSASVTKAPSQTQHLTHPNYNMIPWKLFGTLFKSINKKQNFAWSICNKGASDEDDDDWWRRINIFQMLFWRNFCPQMMSILSFFNFKKIICFFRFFLKINKLWPASTYYKSTILTVSLSRYS